MKSRWASALLLPLWLSGCGSLLHSEYRQPAVQTPAYWFGDASDGRALAAGERWWETFADPRLNALVDDALARNNDLAVAALRVRRATLQAGLTGTSISPDVNVGLGADWSKKLHAGNSSSRRFTTDTAISYEVDLWGRLASTRDAAEWEALATEYDRRASALSLIGTTARLYWRIGLFNELLSSARESIRYAEQTLRLVQSQRLAGAASRLEEAQAEQVLATQRAVLSDYQQQLEAARNALAIVFDRAPEHRLSELEQLPAATLANVPAGLPAHLIDRRPDLQAAEWRLRQALSNYDATRASFYPGFTLTSSLTTGGSRELHNLLSDPAGVLGVGVTLPFLQWNVRKYTVGISKVDYETAIIGFRQGVYVALFEVEDALSAREQFANQGALSEQALAAAVKAEGLAEIRYRSGQTGIKEWLDLQETRRSAQITLAQNRFDRLQAQMGLYLALGGRLRPLNFIPVLTSSYWDDGFAIKEDCVRGLVLVGFV
ncbi:efflux transporter outer membrane subunit [Pseudomonas sp. GL-B-16]|uniref:efflux transporter outer membrane subunit n=1 Tax=Pseudomonas sp. GL-B-16 TaxID=2832373 RepID=UPI001CBB0F42|nr:efflux transporter outer membrane subunit [Pseudomonas sp. GL-B-16]